MRTSENINELVAALSAAQGEFQPIEKNRTGKVQTEKASFTYDYADLSDVMAAVRPALSRHGLCISHDSTVHREPVLAVSVIARLEHSSGQWKESSPLEIPCDGKMGAAQLIGSADTYGRRYTTCSILGVVAESDDDGTTASGIQSETTKREPLPNCPKCGTNKSVIIGKAEFGGGFVCYRAKGGCGEKWHLPPNDAAKRLQDEQEASRQPEAQKSASGDIMAESPPKISAEDAKYIEDSAQAFREAKSDKEARELWRLVAEKPGPIKAALHPIYKEVLQSFSGTA